MASFRYRIGHPSFPDRIVQISSRDRLYHLCYDLFRQRTAVRWQPRLNGVAAEQCDKLGKRIGAVAFLSDASEDAYLLEAYNSTPVVLTPIA